MPTTIEGHIEEALFTRVAAFSTSPALSVALPNNNFTTGDRYLRVMLVPNRTERVTITSTGAHRRYGLLMLSLFMPKNKGSSDATELAGQIAAHFPADLKLTSAAITVRISEAPTVAQAIPEDKHWHVPITVPWEAFA